MNLNSTVELRPLTPLVLHVYVATNHERKKVSVVIAEVSSCLVRRFTWENQRPARLAVGAAINEALQLMTSHCCAETAIKLFSYSFSTLSFVKLGKPLYDVEIKNLQLLGQFASVELCVCDTNSTIHGLRLAVTSSSDDEQLVVLAFPPDKETAKHDYRRFILALWSLQWQTSNSGSITRKFFPSVESAGSIKDKSLSSQLSQILTGHCLLNAHMHRFNLANSPMCGCGQAHETIEHFLFICPAHASVRRPFQLLCETELSQWPPTPSAVAQSNRLWAAMTSFIRKSNRLVFKRSKRSRVDRIATSVLA